MYVSFKRRYLVLSYCIKNLNVTVAFMSKGYSCFKIFVHVVLFPFRTDLIYINWYDQNYFDYKCPDVFISNENNQYGGLREYEFGHQ